MKLNHVSTFSGKGQVEISFSNRDFQPEVDSAIRIKNNNLKWLAIMSLVRQEMIISTDFKNQARKYLRDIPDDRGNLRYPNASKE